MNCHERTDSKTHKTGKTAVVKSSVFSVEFGELWFIISYIHTGSHPQISTWLRRMKVRRMRSKVIKSIMPLFAVFKKKTFPSAASIVHPEVKKRGGHHQRLRLCTPTKKKCNLVFIKSCIWARRVRPEICEHLSCTCSHMLPASGCMSVSQSG